VTNFHKRGVHQDTLFNFMEILVKFSELVKLLEEINLEYSLIIEATEEPDFFGFYSPDLEGFTGIGHSIEDCIYQAKYGMIEHINLLKEQGLPIPPKNPNPKIIIQNQKNLVTV